MQRKKKSFPCLFLCFKLVTPGQGQFWPQGHHKNKLGRGQLADATYQISKHYFFLFQRRKILKFSFFVPMFQTCDTPGRASFDPRSIIWTILVEVHYKMLHTKYQSSAPSSFREDKFQSFLFCSYVSNLWPPGRSHFWPQDHHMNKLGRGQLADATYQISKFCTLQFQRRRILKFSFSVPMFQTCDPLGGASFDPWSIT